MTVFLTVSVSFTESVFFYICEVSYADTNTWSYCRANFNDRFKLRSKECKNVVQAINNRRALRKVTNILVYELIYSHVILNKTEEIDKISLPPLRIEGWAP